MNESDSTKSVSATTDKLWNAEYLKVMTSNFLLFFAFYLLTPLLPLYLDRQFAADKDVIGVVLSGYIVATFLIRPFGGFLVDRFNRKTIFLLCFFAFFICFTGYIGAGTLLMFAIIRTIHGIPFGAATVANSTVAIDVLPDSRRNEGMGFYGLSNNLAMAIAPTLAIYIYNKTDNFQILFWLALVLALIGFLCSTTVKIPHREIVSIKPKFDLDHLFLKSAWLIAINICLFGACWGIINNYVAIYSENELGISEGTGIFFAILSGGLVLSRITGRKGLREGKLVENCLQGMVLCLIGFILFAHSINEWTYYISALFIGLGNGKMYPAFLNMFITLARPDQRGTANSSILISWDIGMGIGILFGGFIAQYWNYHTAFWMSAVIQAVGLIIFLAITRSFFLEQKMYISHGLK